MFQSRASKPDQEKVSSEDELEESSIVSKEKSSTSLKKKRKKLVKAFHTPRCGRRLSMETAIHPFFCRLQESEGFCVTSPDALKNAGFASMALALFTLFRPTPFFLHTVILEVESVSQAQIVNRALLLFLMWLWLSLLFTVLVFLGVVLVVCRHIRKRNVLMLHPWGLLLLYLDVFVWLSLTITVHTEFETWREVRPAFLDRMEYPFVFFFVIYCEVLCLGLLYYFFATFFIAAELTIIENFYP